MKKRIPKTGSADLMRAWMKAQAQPWTVATLCDGLEIPPGKEREKTRNSVGDFENRGEIQRVAPDGRMKVKVNRFRYVRGWKGGREGELKSRICKAMYVSGTFSVRDLVRLCHPPEETEITRSWAEKLTRRLRRDGYLSIVGRRLCAHGAGAESLYHVEDRDKFRLEVMR